MGLAFIIRMLRYVTFYIFFIFIRLTSEIDGMKVTELSHA